MTNQERWALYENGEFRQAIAIDLLDWAGYWTTVGIDGVQDETQKTQMKRAIEIITQDLAYIIGVVASLAISDSGIKQAEPEEVTEALISSVVTAIMSNKLDWVTGITPAAEEE